MEVRKLKPEEWKTFEGIFRNIFNSDLPPAAHSVFYGAFDEIGELQGFLLAEEVRFFGQVFSFKDDPRAIAALVQHARQDTPDSQSVALVASEKRFEPLLERLGLERIEGTLYRRG